MNPAVSPLPPPPRRWLARLASAVALLVSVGCYKSSDAMFYSETPADPAAAQTIDITGASRSYADADEEVGGSYDYRNDIVEGESFKAESTVIASPAFEDRAREQLGEAREWVPPARTKPGAPSTGKAEPDQPEAEPGTGASPSKDDQPEHGRQIIYTAGLQISVYDLDSAMATVEAAPEKFGGWVHMRNQQQVVLRLPAKSLKPAMAELATLGVVEARTLQAQDVTAEYVDLDSRIKVLRETQTQLLALLEQAKTVEEALHVRKALDQVTMELEVALGRMRQLSDLIAYSTLTVTLVERGPQDHIPTSNDPFGWVDSLGVEATEWR